MIIGIKQKATVQPGGIVEVHSPELTPGAIVEVIILLDSPSETPAPLASFIGAGQASFPTPAAADQFLRQERDAWEP